MDDIYCIILSEYKDYAIEYESEGIALLWVNGLVARSEKAVMETWEFFQAVTIADALGLRAVVLENRAYVALHIDHNRGAMTELEVKARIIDRKNR